MKSKILLILGMLFMLAGCSRSKLPALQPFEGQTVATLQTPASMADLAATPERREQDASPIDEQGLEVTPEDGFPPDREQGSDDNSELPNPLANPETEPPGFTTTTSPTPTAGVLTNPVWAGTWNIWYQRGTGDYDTAVLTLEVSGNEVSGTATLSAVDYIFKGVILADRSQVEGDWNDGQQEGKFWWQLSSDNIFIGSHEARFGFCGNRGAVEQPQNCRKILP